MTGYGEASGEVDGVVYTVELRSVNNRYFKVQMRLPDVASFLETEIEKVLKNDITRGSVNYSLRMKNVSGQALFDVDEYMIKTYTGKLEEIAKCHGTQCRIDLAGMLNLPGIVKSVELNESWAMQMKEVVLGLTDQALDQLKQMRIDEGRSLGEDMIANCNLIAEKVAQIKDRSAVVVQEYNEKLRKRANVLLESSQLKIDENTLIREVAVFADRSDIAEEVLRLGSHLQQFDKHCTGEDHAGRRLDFIAQEMLRETNTIASKASDILISQLVIDIKCLIDRIKEQVQNVE